MSTSNLSSVSDKFINWAYLKAIESIGVDAIPASRRGLQCMEQDSAMFRLLLSVPQDNVFRIHDAEYQLKASTMLIRSVIHELFHKPEV